jgi:asparagine N-glycosylation enzyme membrane subunit Stt3
MNNLFFNFLYPHFIISIICPLIGYLMMHLGKSKLAWIVMAAFMLLMLSQGYRSNNMMLVMMGAMAIIVMGYLMKGRNIENR